MSNEVVKYVSKSLVKSKSQSGTAGKALVVGGTAAFALSLLPFVALWMAVLAVIGLGFAFAE